MSMGWRSVSRGFSMKMSINTFLAVGASLVAGFLATQVNADEASVWTKIQSNPDTTVFAGYANELGLAEALNTENLIIAWSLGILGRAK